MADTTFSELTNESGPQLTDYMVGYRNTSLGGERRYQLAQVQNLLAEYFAVAENTPILLSGSGAPDDVSTGKDGDYYLDLTSKMLWGPKTAGDWGSTPLSLNGIPTGGASQAILKKASASNYDAAWVAAAKNQILAAGFDGTVAFHAREDFCFFRNECENISTSATINNWDGNVSAGGTVGCFQNDTYLGTTAFENIFDASDRFGLIFIAISTTASSKSAAIFAPSQGGSPRGWPMWWRGSGGKKWSMRAKVLIPNLSASGDDFSFVFGFGQTFWNYGYAGASVPSHFAGFIYNHGLNSAKWLAASANTSATTADTGITVVANTFYDLQLDFDGTSLLYYINGTLVSTITTNFPRNTGNQCTCSPASAMIARNGSSGSNTRSVIIDRLSYLQER